MALPPSVRARLAALHVQATLTDRGRVAAREAASVLVLSLGVLTTLSLLSYSPLDASLNQAWGQGAASLNNWIGPMGAAWADLCFQIMGVAAWLFDAVLLLVGGRLILNRRGWPSRRQWGAVVGLLTSLGTLLELLFLGNRSSYPLGGVLGALFARSLREHFAPVGAATLAATGAILSLVLCLEGVLSTLARRLNAQSSRFGDQAGTHAGLALARARAQARDRFLPERLQRWAAARRTPAWLAPAAAGLAAAPRGVAAATDETQTLAAPGPAAAAAAAQPAAGAPDLGPQAKAPETPTAAAQDLGTAAQDAQTADPVHATAAAAAVPDPWVAAADGRAAAAQQASGRPVLATGTAVPGPATSWGPGDMASALAREAVAAAGPAAALGDSAPAAAANPPGGMQAAPTAEDAPLDTAPVAAPPSADAEAVPVAAADLRAATATGVPTTLAALAEEQEVGARLHADLAHGEDPLWVQDVAPAHPGAAAAPPAEVHGGTAATAHDGGAMAVDSAPGEGPALRETADAALHVPAATPTAHDGAANAQSTLPADDVLRQNAPSASAAEAADLPGQTASPADAAAALDAQAADAAADAAMASAGVAAPEYGAPLAVEDAAAGEGSAAAAATRRAEDAAADEEFAALAADPVAEDAAAGEESTAFTAARAAEEAAVGEGAAAPAAALAAEEAATGEAAGMLAAAWAAEGAAADEAAETPAVATEDVAHADAAAVTADFAPLAADLATAANEPAELGDVPAVAAAPAGAGAAAADDVLSANAPAASAEIAAPLDADADAVAEGLPRPQAQQQAQAAATAAAEQGLSAGMAQPVAAPQAAAQGTAPPLPYVLPPTELLHFEAAEQMPVSLDTLQENAARLTKTLSDYGIDGHVREIRPGPVVTLYEYVPGPGIKLAKIASLADDLAMSMEAFRVRIVAPIPGKGAVGIEIPNDSRELVHLKEIVTDDDFVTAPSPLTLALGKDIEGAPCSADLARMPHLLVAGATGAGKSVSVNAMIMSVLFKATPEEVRMIMVDPKMLELSVYEGIPHLLLPVVTEPKKAATALRWAVTEMERRYELLSLVGVRNIEGYNARVRSGEAAGEPLTVAGSHADDPRKVCAALPYLLVVVDELADLMMVAPREVEGSIMRLAQMARAAGIHLILATQRPSVDVLTGVIKANFPTRIAFQVASRHDSRTIIDANGAEHLLGRGDMLLMSSGAGGIRRVHGAYLSEEDIARTVSFVRNQRRPAYDESILAEAQEEPEQGADEEAHRDEMYDQAVAVVAETQQASISMIQRRLRIGYNRAARMVDWMEQEGIVGPGDGAKPREVFVHHP